MEAISDGNQCAAMCRPESQIGGDCPSEVEGRGNRLNETPWPPAKTCF